MSTGKNAFSRKTSFIDSLAMPDTLSGMNSSRKMATGSGDRAKVDPILSRPGLRYGEAATRLEFS